jgi:predicted nucleic acid-binding protein
LNLTVVLDADFLSAFLKIERLPLLRQFYQVETLWVPPAVFREVALTDLLPQLTALSWIRVKAPSSAHLETLSTHDEFQRLGAGEQEAIALVLEHPPAVLLVNDNQARRVAGQLSVSVVNIPAFLLACKMSGLLDRNTLSDLITTLRDKDFYGFRQDVLDLLLS